ncbi:malonyl-CoA decarboxylase [Sediminicurvatus halobius]|uniref:MCD, Malonyl-CoA decarboxylase MCD n=1 Tax=Sediminicurvatus halobius TaxID=2182432 RepID=A0A2U2MYT1_9GAMM|nr:malonyl-CoA decarboxylase [Spiribacter halobius]PWG62040.1 MCD, Malonyl-CoA decarboxylase MCD [Spiribacter halobius]UEX78695.1 malonyl-CoA decarboxylase [Spiribacter halobius]
MNVSFLQDLIQTITQRDALSRRQAAARLPKDHQGMVEACTELMESDGEASSIALAQRALDLYELLPAAERERFFQVLAEDFSADPAAIDAAYQAYRERGDGRSLSALFQACEPRRQELLRRLNLPAGGTFELVRMREDLLRLLPEHPEFEAVDADFAHLFGSWFNRGFLVLRRIDWHTPAAILEKIIDYEAVHAISDWSDLRRRLDPKDRRCFAFFHPAIGDEPLIFLEVALHKGIPDQVQGILNQQHKAVDAPERADTAAFYGISNCQRGLRGISFGNFLIKQVVLELAQELPNLRNFVTLSPVPGFRRWLQELVDDPSEPLDDDTRTLLAGLETPDWHRDETLSGKLKAVMLPLAAHYLTAARNEEGQPLNPVARFHLGNGARLHRINWLGDTSGKGLQQGAGLMVNYLYVLDEIERNHEQFTARGTIATSSEVRDLARRARKILKEAARG